METKAKHRSRWFGDRRFYASVFKLIIPVMIQNGITTFVNMLDNIMVGQVGTLPMSAASISNQIMMIFNLAVFGATGAIGIFGAQYYGKNDKLGVSRCYHLKVYVGLITSGLGVLILLLFGNPLIKLYMNSAANTAEDIALTMEYARTYMLIMLIGMPIFAQMSAISSTAREGGETFLPMVASVSAVLVNFVGNYTLIFGHFGAPKLGIAGAAIATVISRYVEFFILFIGTRMNREKFHFYDGFFSNMKVPGTLVRDVAIKGAPLVVNEVLWSFAIAAIAQSYSTRGLNAVAAINITHTVQSVFMITNMAMGMAISVMVGQLLGANKTEEAKDTNWKLVVFSVLASACMGIVMFAFAPLFPKLYNTSEEVRLLAQNLLKINAVYMPVSAVYNAAYSTLRSGGKTVITFFFDSVYSCLVNLPVAFCLSRFTRLPVLWLFLIVQGSDIPQAILGLYLVKKGVWVQNLVGTDEK